ncbi:hypothetical protein YC2023_112161 [Brassica napus]
MHLALTTSKNNSLCLDVDATNNILANPCKCLSKDSSCQPMSQWFKIINATRPLESSKLYKQLENLSPRSDMLGRLKYLVIDDGDTVAPLDFCNNSLCLPGGSIDYSTTLSFLFGLKVLRQQQQQQQQNLIFCFLPF